ncbi:MAG: insulinase family protein [Candidatus Marinimicrobia bacterium]|nr:insulinase family protein [Candidatus Neomarinimicrobiota bacterium]
MINPINCELTTLANGLRVVSAPLPQVASVALGLFVGVGGRHETPAQAGMSHFIEHLLFKGTRRLTARQISDAIEGRGGYFNAYTQEESTCYYARVQARHLERVADILLDMYREPRIAPRDLEKERGVIIEEILMYRDQPDHVVAEWIGELLWTAHPLGRPLSGEPEDIRRHSRADLLAFKEAHYVPNRTLAICAGQVRHADWVALLDKRLGRQTAAPALRPPTVTRRTRQTPLRTATRPIEQTHLALGFRLDFGRRDPRRYALRLLNVLLGENMSSRLFQSVRERRGWAYAIHSHAQLFQETGALEVGADLRRDRAEPALGVILGELQRLCDTPVRPAELRRAKDYAIGQLLLALENTSAVMRALGEGLLAHERIVQPAEIVAGLEAVTPAELQALARTVFLAPRASLAVLTPEANPLAPDRAHTLLARLNA